MKPEGMKYLRPGEKKHYMKCPDCGEYFDMRDLQDVFNHFHKSAAVKAEYTHSIRVGEPVVYTKEKKKLDLN
jgi:hypothetical protein